ncbi:MAG: polysaccharide deacetylase family protein [Caldilineaceae bacterium]|nr:polysaccharide deacetylase family protein [Caldilineaceae bacterium]
MARILPPKIHQLVKSTPAPGLARVLLSLGLFALIAVVGSCQGAAGTTGQPVPFLAGFFATATPIATPTPTLTPTATETPTATATSTSTATRTPSPSPTASVTLTPTLAASATPTVTPSETPTPTPSPGPTPDGEVRSARVPILMYHYLSIPPADADRYRLDLSVSPDLFAAHLDAIQAAGYTTIGLDLLMQNLTHGVPLPEKSVILTFDDGYRDNYENAFPLLKEHGMVATFFISTDFTDEQRPLYMTWEMLREMRDAGMTIGSHGRNHVSLKNKDVDYLVWQALGSSQTIEFELGEAPRFMSYPAGEYDDLTRQIFHEANYWAGLTTIQGATHHSDDLFQLHRVRVRGTTTPEELVRLLGVDW